MGVTWVVMVSCICAIGHAAKFPKNWTACKPDENMNACLRESIQTAMTDLIAGMPSLGVFPLDPLHFEALTIDQGEGPVSIKLEFKNLDAVGIKDIHVESVESDWVTMVVRMSAPKITLKGIYKIGGKVLLLPIQGEGNCALEMDNFKGMVTLHYGEKTAGSKAYYNIEKVEFDFDVDLLQMQFENLFNGDKALGDNMNNFLNQNWKEILHELKPNIGATFAAAFKEIGNRLFSKITKNQITPSR